MPSLFEEADGTKPFNRDRSGIRTRCLCVKRRADYSLGRAQVMKVLRFHSSLIVNGFLFNLGLMRN